MGPPSCPNSLHYFGEDFGPQVRVGSPPGGTAKELLSPLPLEDVLSLLAARWPRSVLSRTGYVKSTGHLSELCLGLISLVYS